MFNDVAKFEELDSRIPKLTDLPALVGYEMSLAEFVQLEIFVLNSFNWRISWPTPAHFAEFYSLCAVNAGDRDYNCTPHHHLSDLITSSLRDFLDVTLSGKFWILFLFNVLSLSSFKKLIGNRMFFCGKIHSRSLKL